MEVLLDSPVLVIVIAALLVYILLTSTLAFRRSGKTAPAEAGQTDCASCGQANPAKATFCRRCGKKLGS